MKFFSIKKFHEQIKHDVQTRNPKWFFYADGEDGYHPWGKELIKRAIMNGMIFIGNIVIIIYISILGIQTPVFQFLRNLSIALQEKDMLWLAYGTILGIGGTLIFGSITDPNKSVESRFLISISYLMYFAFFFIFLNILFLMIHI